MKNTIILTQFFHFLWALIILITLYIYAMHTFFKTFLNTYFKLSPLWIILPIIFFSLNRLLQQLHQFYLTLSTTFHQYTSAYLLSNYPSSMRCRTKPGIANPSHQLHFIVPYPPTTQRPVSWLPSKICPTATIYLTTFHPAFHQNTLNNYNEGFL